MVGDSLGHYLWQRVLCLLPHSPDCARTLQGAIFLYSSLLPMFLEYDRKEIVGTSFATDKLSI